MVRELKKTLISYGTHENIYIDLNEFKSSDESGEYVIIGHASHYGDKYPNLDFIIVDCYRLIKLNGFKLFEIYETLIGDLDIIGLCIIGDGDRAMTNICEEKIDDNEFFSNTIDCLNRMESLKSQKYEKLFQNLNETNLTLKKSYMKLVVFKNLKNETCSSAAIDVRRRILPRELDDDFPEMESRSEISENFSSFSNQYGNKPSPSTSTMSDIGAGEDRGIRPNILQTHSLTDLGSGKSDRSSSKNDEDISTRSFYHNWLEIQFIEDNESFRMKCLFGTISFPLNQFPIYSRELLVKNRSDITYHRITQQIVNNISSLLFSYRSFFSKEFENCWMKLNNKIQSFEFHLPFDFDILPIYKEEIILNEPLRSFAGFMSPIQMKDVDTSRMINLTGNEGNVLRLQMKILAMSPLKERHVKQIFSIDVIKALTRMEECYSEYILNTTLHPFLQKIFSNLTELENDHILLPNLPCRLFVGKNFVNKDENIFSDYSPIPLLRSFDEMHDYCCEYLQSLIIYDQSKTGQQLKVEDGVDRPSIYASQYREELSLNDINRYKQYIEIQSKKYRWRSNEKVTKYSKLIKRLEEQLVNNNSQFFLYFSIFIILLSFFLNYFL
ncbi:hypothetical protein SNEBB_007658 [Seison nebaliae]|nr:hypothetical protein SNEBB_007658 [Seison nebaliae]